LLCDVLAEDEHPRMLREEIQERAIDLDGKMARAIGALGERLFGAEVGEATIVEVRARRLGCDAVRVVRRERRDDFGGGCELRMAHSLARRGGHLLAR